MPQREQAVLWIRRSGLSRECRRQGFVQQTCEEKPDQLQGRDRGGGGQRGSAGSVAVIFGVLKVLAGGRIGGS